MDETNDGRVAVQIRLPRELVERMAHYCIDHHLYRQQLIEQLVRERLEPTRVATRRDS